MTSRAALSIRLLLLGGLALLVSCSSTSPERGAASSGAKPSQPRPLKDGAPWWDVDVSKIPDAVPTPHYGPVKANPYTVLGKTYYPMNDGRRYKATGTASWYGTKFHGQATANGELYDLYGMSAAHKTLPLPSYVRVTNLDNQKSVILRVNDRGPFYSERIIDLSFAAAKKLGYAETGTARVSVEGIDPEEWLAQQGRKPPLAPTRPPLAEARPAAQPIEEYSPPPTQHAAPVLPVAVAAGPAVAAPDAGLYLQVGAFANPDAAELLKDKLSRISSTPVFVSPVVRDRQTFHRVRLGPIGSQDEARRLQDSVRLARLGQPTLVRPD
ncbi:Rare lipoprotein, RlpA family [Azotobacter vinelandii CA]|uniref:Endolytic peptidoglycan transglycosylase RlpA n=2 Tax=Azotobacter vinelandii TaxID=354 RepID=C1DMQ7_AZOVD|nr:septal ring lytic transglycosylase RlpA family protein [Azotobacter vinelandii]ACO77087.1 Rare lipoprotein, RlpA family [Azotobacter vinelandii DJ]AGK15494.1 Rare lipoprotein, RlpA family [Azotobacter vinelandii CA]AGK19555.1 Rare lipoprotein, RlpA family [Azotobacter vinelandii CA6]WKN22814.1 septal ring lytic transglycosylase RlpA family protein [Azotobacter vinelandii]SFX94396.1 rare lipoprotein A [Azotobacter vinelandii]